jgi:carbonic anhydrase
LHFVHQNAAGSLAVVGVLMEAGGSNPAFNEVVSTMPQQAGEKVKADAAIDPTNSCRRSGHIIAILAR